EGVGHETVKYAALGSSKGLTEWVGARQYKSLKGYSINISNTLLEDGFPVPVDAIKRDSLGLFGNRSIDMANKAQFHWNKMVVDLITANGTGPDGLAFFSSTRKPDGVTTSSNIVTASEISALNVTTAATPTPVEASAVLLGCIGYMQTYLDESGKVATGGARSFTVVTRTVDHYAAFLSAATSNFLTSGQSNPVAALLATGYNVKVVLETGIGGTADFYVLRDDGASDKPFILQSENGIEFQQITDPNDSFVVNNNEYFFGVKTLRGGGYGRWDYALKATLS
ncbi:MAG: Mu-like prophage major head subunit gpT family protein, partial [Candidatus Andersenbacteria bacterium]